MAVLKIVTRILSYICYAVIGIYVLVCAPMVFRCQPIVVLSGSMLPTYQVGSIIYYKPVDKSEIAAGDVITYKLNNTLVTHRVQRVVNGEYVTKGDNNNVEDSRAVKYEDVQGKVGGLNIPILGYGVQFIKDNPWIFIIIVGILLAEFLMSNVKRDKISVSEKGRKHEKDDEDLDH